MRARWSTRAPASSRPRPTRRSPWRSRRSSRRPASSARRPTTRSASSSAGAAKNAAALAAGATERQGLNAAGAAAGHIFAEVWRYAEALGARPESLIGLAGTGDLVATALAPMSRNRRAGELLADGVPAAEIPERIGQAVEAMEGVLLLAQAPQGAGLDAPVTTACTTDLRRPLDDWVALVRTTVTAAGLLAPAPRQVRLLAAAAHPPARRRDRPDRVAGSVFGGA